MLFILRRKLTSIILIIPFSLIHVQIISIDILIRLLFVLLFPFILYLFNIYEQIEIITIKNIAKKILKFNN